jgi:hypothetical protein
VLAVRRRHPARPGGRRAVRGAGSLLGRCHDFGKLSTREAQRTEPARIGPRRDELGTFATLISRFGPTLTPGFEKALRTLGEGPLVDLVRELEHGGEAERLAAMEVNEALGHLWPRLQELRELMPAS